MTIATPPRPTATLDIKLEAARIVAQQLGDADAATIAEHYSLGMDGYRLAKELDTMAFWDCTRDDVDVLDEMDSLVREAVAKAEMQWAAEHGIQPPLPVGARIRWACSTGTITDIYEHAAASYLVKIDGYDDSRGNRRAIVKFEDAQECTGPVFPARPSTD